MSTENLKPTEDLQPEKAETVAEQPDASIESAGSADVDVNSFIEEYTGMTDTMVAGKTAMSGTMVADKTAMSGTMVADKTAMSGTMVADKTAMSGTMVADKTAMSGTMVADKTAMSGTMVADKTAISNTIVADQTTMSNTLIADRTAMSGTVQGKASSGVDAGDKKGLDESAETDPETEAIKEKIRERKREKIRKARARRIRFWTLFIILMIAIAAGAFSLSGFFTVDSIEVNGNSHFTAEEIINNRIHADGFLRKPVVREKLYEKLDMFYKMSYFTRIELKRGTGFETLYAQEILYAQADDKRVILHLADRDESFNYLLGDLEKVLESCGLFYRIHRSYIINLLHVRRYDSSHVELKNGVSLPLKARGFKEKYQSFIFSQHR